jgi:hypothetical protein
MLVPTIAAAVRADTGRSEQRVGRARFRHSQEGLALYDWFLPRDAMYRERDLVRAAERHQETVRRSFLRKITDLPAAGFAELVATWLNAEGVAGLRGVRRPTSSNLEMHFAGTLRRGFEELRLAIVVLRSGQELTRERVVELRGSLHHYANATLGWVVSTAAVPRATRDEATAPGATPIAVFDGLALAEAMESRGVGMRRTSVPLSVIDLDTLDALRGSAEAPLREQGERGPDRGERPERGDRGERDRGEARAEGRDRREERRERDERRDERESPRPAPSGESAGDARAETGAGTEIEVSAEGVPSPEGGPARVDPPEARGEEGGRRRRRRRRRRGGQDRGPGVQDAGAAAADAELDDPAEAAESPEASGTGEDDILDEESIAEHDDLHDAEEIGDDDEAQPAASDDDTEPAAADDEDDEAGSEEE